MGVGWGSASSPLPGGGGEERRKAALEVVEADPRRAAHDEVRPWLLRLAAGEFDAPPPRPR